MGYHKKEIVKGILGEKSKVREELDEFLDAFEQKDYVLCLCEVSDILGAMESYIGEDLFKEKLHTITLLDIIKFDVEDLEIYYAVLDSDPDSLLKCLGYFLKLFNLKLTDSYNFTQKTKQAFIEGKR